MELGLGIMKKRPHSFEYNGKPIFNHLKKDVPLANTDSTFNDFFVYVMGPYTAFDVMYAFEDADKLETRYIEDPLFDPELHDNDDGNSKLEQILAGLCEYMREEIGVRAFIATDIAIPTMQDVKENNLNQPAMTPLDQSIAFSAVSDAVIFVFSESGRTTGVGAEVGAVLCEFGLRVRSALTGRKPRQRFRVFETPGFKSASVNEIPGGFDIESNEFNNKKEIKTQIRAFLTGVERTAREKNLPIYCQHGME